MQVSGIVFVGCPFYHSGTFSGRRSILSMIMYKMLFHGTANM